MAYTDSLFQLGMDLTRSSTAQEEDHGRSAPRAPEICKDHFVERDGVRFAGSHLLIDLYGASRLDDLKHVERTLRRCAEVSGASLRSVHLHTLNPSGGVAGVAVLEQSHISIHSWPDKGYAALDVFMSGDTRPEVCIDFLKRAFEAREAVVKSHRRGEETSAPVRRPSIEPRRRRAVRLKAVAG